MRKQTWLRKESIKVAVHKGDRILIRAERIQFSNSFYEIIRNLAHESNRKRNRIGRIAGRIRKYPNTDDVIRFGLGNADDAPASSSFATLGYFPLYSEDFFQISNYFFSS